MSRREANMTVEKRRGGKTVTQFLETQGAFEWTAGERPFHIDERRLIRGKAASGTRRGTRRRRRLSSSASFYVAPPGSSTSTIPPKREATCRIVCGKEREPRERRDSERPRSRLGNWRVYSAQIKVYNSRYNPASAPNTLNGALIQALSGSSVVCKFVIEDFNELASPRMARRSRDRKWLISIHFGNYRLNARADIIIRGPILSGDSLLRQSNSPGLLPLRTRVHCLVTLWSCPSRCLCKIS